MTKQNMDSKTVRFVLGSGVKMCSDKKFNLRSRSKNNSTNTERNGIDYLQLETPIPGEDQAPKHESRLCEKVVFTLTTAAMIGLSHAIVWAQWAVPIFYAVITPIIVGIKTTVYWRNKWQYFMMDFCYIGNTLLLTYLWVPGNGYVFQAVFALANGPVLAGSFLYRNSLVYHHHDKVTSLYIHILPPVVTFCIRWFPEDTSLFWYQPFVGKMPEFNLVWLYAVPFFIFFIHSAMYCLLVNVLLRPKDPYVTSYSYLAVKYAKLNILGGPIGHFVVYYGGGWIFCLSSLTLSLLAFSSFPAHCAILAALFLAVVWNGASYYVHVFSERGFDDVNG